MIIDRSLQRHYDKMLLALNAEREATHEPSGKLSASMLYQPLRFQVLKTLGAPRRPMEAYVLGKFQRGDEVEKTVAKVAGDLGILIEQQMFVEYRGAVGYVDMVVDTGKAEFKHGVMPWEVKSVTNAKLKRIEKTEVDYHYQLQACFYAMALKSEYYGVVVASGEDNRMTTYVEPARKLKEDVDKAIDAYEEAMKAWKTNMTLPPFEPNPKVAWTSNPAYAMYEPFWFETDDATVIRKLAELGIV
jgi:hypothetical protein